MRRTSSVRRSAIFSPSTKIVHASSAVISRTADEAGAGARLGAGFGADGTGLGRGGVCGGSNASIAASASVRTVGPIMQGRPPRAGGAFYGPRRGGGNVLPRRRDASPVQVSGVDRVPGSAGRNRRRQRDP